MSKVKLYFDLLSQPSRTVAMFLALNKIPTELKNIRLGNGDHKSEEFLKINPLHQVPVIEDNGFILRESVAILRYLCREKNVDEFWYPKGAKEQARVDEYLEWQHLGTRANCALYFRTMWMEPFFTGKAPSESKVAKLKQNMIDTCDLVENFWLKEKKYICGDHITIADLLAATELEQPRMSGYDPREGRPKLTEWMARVRDDTNPHYDTAHKALNHIVTKFKGVSPALLK